MDYEASLSAGQYFVLITQNVDGLHQRAGSRNVIELHGSIHKTHCANPACTLAAFEDANPHQQEIPRCPVCTNVLRPGIVLFGEPLPAEQSWRAKRALREWDLFIAIGTSGTVAPASNFVRSADYAGARTIYINLEPLDPPNPAFQEHYYGPAEHLLPELLA